MTQFSKEAFPPHAKVNKRYCLYCNKLFFSNRPRAQYCRSTCRVYGNEKLKEKQHPKVILSQPINSPLAENQTPVGSMQRGDKFSQVETPLQENKTRYVLLVWQNGTLEEVTPQHLTAVGETDLQLQNLWLYKELQDYMQMCTNLEAENEQIKQEIRLGRTL